MINIVMAKLKIFVAGAPFDEGNLFLVPATDAGPFVNPYPTANFVNLDGGSFSDPADILVDGGVIPLAGTATYDPTRTYGPDDKIEIEVDIED